MTGIAAWVERRDTTEHGTRARYVIGCRCEACGEANNAHCRDRSKRVRDALAEAVPSGAPIESTMRRGGYEVRVKRCPGVNGAACVRPTPAWLKNGKAVCVACVDRSAIWDGNVPVDRARAHLRALSAQGVGYKAVADACDVAPSTLCRVLLDNGSIRASTERAILAVDAGAIADGAPVDAAETNALLAKMRERGFTHRHLARLLGHSERATSCQIGIRPQCSAATRARVARLWTRIERGEVVPARALMEAPDERSFLDRCFAAGLTERWLSNAIGVSVHRHPTPRMYVKTAEAIRAWRDRMRDEFADGLPDGWTLANASAVADAFSWGGGWHQAHLSRGEPAPKTKKRMKAKAPTLTPEERRAADRESMRARRAAMGAEAVREENRRNQRAKRARDRANYSEREAVAA